jgi:hypothetical protein
MRTATCLTLLAVGAILTFAVTGHPRFINVQVAGLVVMATGAAGLLMPRGGSGWLHRRIVVRPSPGGRVIGRRTSRYGRYQLGSASGSGSNGRYANGRVTRPGNGGDTAPQPAADGRAAPPASHSTATGQFDPDAQTQVVDEYLES